MWTTDPPAVPGWYWTRSREAPDEDWTLGVARRTLRAWYRSDVGDPHAPIPLDAFCGPDDDQELQVWPEPICPPEQARARAQAPNTSAVYALSDGTQTSDPGIALADAERCQDRMLQILRRARALLTLERGSPPYAVEQDALLYIIDPTTGGVRMQDAEEEEDTHG